MVISFEEKDRVTIEAKGMTVIEFKRILYRTEKGIEHVWEVLRECADKMQWHGMYLKRNSLKRWTV